MARSESSYCARSATLRSNETLRRGTLPRMPCLARTIVENWRDDYNALRPHSALGNQTPQEFAQQMTRKPPVGF